LKGKKEDKMFRELFRHKLENAEITPSPAVSADLMRKLGRREFLRFNPSRFNIWYAGAVVVAGTALAIILSSGPDKKTEKQPVTPGTEVSEAVVHDLKSGRVTVPVQPAARSNNTAGRSDRNNTLTRTNAGNNISSDQKNTVQNNKVESPSGVTGSIAGQGLLKESGDQKNMLRGRMKPGESLIQASVTKGCTPLKVRFRNIAAAYDSCLWTFGDGGHSSEKNPEWLFDVPGDYDVILTVYGTDGLNAAYSAIITVNPRPVARFEFSPENAILPDDEIRFMNYSTDAVRYKWTFGDGSTSDQFEPKHSYRKFGKYSIKLVAISESGCTDSTSVMNAFSGAGYTIEFPNAFIPNPNGPSGGYYSPMSDEASQVFHPVSAGVSDYQLRIFSKRGILIFESNDINIGWDGYFKGQLSEPGVYIWKVRGNFMNGEPFTKMGDVTLLKN
jgi:PKD repeat protein